MLAVVPAQLKSQTIYLVDALENGLLREIQKVGKYLHPDDRLIIGRMELAEQRHAEAERRWQEERRHPIFGLFVARPIRDRLVETCLY
jgi:hypothetical protein